MKKAIFLILLLIFVSACTTNQSKCGNLICERDETEENCPSDCFVERSENIETARSLLAKAIELKGTIFVSDEISLGAWEKMSLKKIAVGTGLDSSHLCFSQGDFYGEEKLNLSINYIIENTETKINAFMAIACDWNIEALEERLDDSNKPVLSAKNLEKCSCEDWTCCALIMKKKIDEKDQAEEKKCVELTELTKAVNGTTCEDVNFDSRADIDRDGEISQKDIDAITGFSDKKCRSLLEDKRNWCEKTDKDDLFIDEIVSVDANQTAYSYKAKLEFTGSNSTGITVFVSSNVSRDGKVLCLAKPRVIQMQGNSMEIEFFEDCDLNGFGTYTFGVIAIANNSEKDAVTENNSKTKSFELSSPIEPTGLPDLILAYARIPESELVIGSDFRIEYAILNIGSEKFETTDFFWAHIKIYDSESFEDTTMQVPLASLEAGETSNTITYFATDQTPIGHFDEATDYSLKITIDHFDQVEEENKNNNSIIQNFSVLDINSPPPFCSDSDSQFGSDDYTVTGSCFDLFNYLSDSCDSGTILREGRCTAGVCQFISVDCVYHGFNSCENGKCVNTVQCTDSDGGSDYYIQGTTYGKYQEEYGYEPETKNWVDSCVDKFYVREYICKTYLDPSYAAEDVWSESYRCEYGCRDGACLSQIDPCTETDGGRNYWKKGTLNGFYKPTGPVTEEDTCIDLLTNQTVTECSGESCAVSEHWCEPDETNPGFYLKTYYECPTGCSNGACVSGAYEIDNCVDEDGGTNLFNKATVTGEDIYSGEIVEKTDECISDLYGEGYDGVSEYTCWKYDTDKNAAVFPISYHCFNGCSNGACLE